MMGKQQETETLKAEIIAMAHATMPGLDGDALEFLIDASSILFAVWPEDANPSGHGLLALKGGDDLKSADKIAAVWVPNVEQATLLRRTIKRRLAERTLQ